MSKDEAMGIAGRVLERYGFPTLVALALMWFLRADLLVPLVDAHVKFIDEMTSTQREMVQSMKEQTKILQSIEARSASKAQVASQN